MSDSVGMQFINLAFTHIPPTSANTAAPTDRVFVHALNTVKKIPRMGSARPPPAQRLRLYGLYKQSMGMSRPIPG